MIEVQKSSNEIGLRVSGELLEQVYQWEASVDEMVFREQLTTGSFKGRLKVDGTMLAFMQQVAQAGKIMPYYGAGGSSGACVYKFQFNGADCLFQVKHTVALETFAVNQAFQRVTIPEEWERESEIQFSILPFILNEELSHPWTGERNPKLVCRIMGQEYNNLQAWSNWLEDQALTSRYIYQFGQVSMGPTSFAVKVHDTQTNSTTDVTDYDAW